MTIALRPIKASSLAMTSPSFSSPKPPCAGCKLLRRRCSNDCILVPYFPSTDPEKFASVHRVFGASNVCKMLHYIGEEKREDAVKSLAYEARARLNDPIYGCVGFISCFQDQISRLQSDLAMALAENVLLRSQLSEALRALACTKNEAISETLDDASLYTFGQISFGRDYSDSFHDY